MDFNLLIIYVITVLMLIATPGPVVFLVINTTIKSGPSTALRTVLGTNWASLVLIVIAVLIISTSLVISPKLFSLISLLGCLFIGYMAINTIREALSLDKEYVFKQEQLVVKNGGLLNGFLIGLSNPKDIIFFVSFFPQFIKVTDSFNKSIFLLTLLWILLDFLILGFYIVFIRRVSTPKVKNIIVLFSGFILLVIAMIGFLYSFFELISV
ncbi:LysE family translocator [Entomomonas moraniae]|uniref:LysE family translocator n=1 Tax=Entomomonas moraniae TaxID=2213226 RepID=A0A3Q9JHZ0_9GAMM|nr:LysE family translocator [Entomomonas moraniae]AZS49943.1 LysE family translocator [Entomomonas moraniae]